VSELVTRDRQPGFSSIAFQALLDASDRDGLTSKRAFFGQKDLSDSAGGSGLQIGHKGLVGILAEVNHPAFAPFAVLNQNL
jgi:hypothetical protein